MKKKPRPKLQNFGNDLSKAFDNHFAQKEQRVRGGGASIAEIFNNITTVAEDIRQAEQDLISRATYLQGSKSYSRPLFNDWDRREAIAMYKGKGNKNLFRCSECQCTKKIAQPFGLLDCLECESSHSMTNALYYFYSDEFPEKLIFGPHYVEQQKKLKADRRKYLQEVESCKK